MADLGTYPVATGQNGPSRPQATADLLLLWRLSGGTSIPAELEPLARTLAESEPTVRSALALGPSAAARLRKALETAPRQILADLVVDRLLPPGMVPSDTAARELTDVRSRVGKLGPPFDARKPVVRVDALLWLAALADPDDIPALAAGPLRFYAETPVRVPAADQYESDTARPAGTQARPVIGAVFAPLLIRESRPAVK
jgi:hypothetical protein